MISFHTPESDFPFTRENLMSIEDTASAITKAHMQFTEARLMEALIARFGELPSHEDIAAHCMKVTDHENVTHFLWFDDEKPKHGEKIDLSVALCRIAPPKIYTKPEN